MLTAGLIYFSLLFYSLLTAFKYKNYNHDIIAKWSYNNKPTLIATLIIVSIIIISSVRDNVGTDYESYFNLYKYYQNSDINFSVFNEFGFHLIILSGIYLSYPAIWMFFSSSLISWGLLLKINNSSYLLFVIVFLILDEKLFWSFNGVRQWMAISSFIIAVNYLRDYKYLYFVFLIFLGSLFHTSILYIVPVVLILNTLSKIDIYKYKFLVIITYILTLNIGTNEIVMNYISNLTINLGEQYEYTSYYARHAVLGRILEYSNEVGIGFWIKRVLDFILIYQLFKLKDKNIKLWVLLFLIGTIYFNLFYSNQILLRVSIYFLIFRSLLWGYVVYKFKERNFLNNIAILLYIIIFVNAFYRGSNMCCPYNFIF